MSHLHREDEEWFRAEAARYRAKAMRTARWTDRLVLLLWAFAVGVQVPFLLRPGVQVITSVSIGVMLWMGISWWTRWRWINHLLRWSDRDA